MIKKLTTTLLDQSKISSVNFAGLRKTLDRRTFLKGSGVALALPFLEAMAPSAYAASKKSPKDPMRLVILMNSLSLLPQHFFPKKAGFGYDSTPYLDLLSAHRKR